MLADLVFLVMGCGLRCVGHGLWVVDRGCSEKLYVIMVANGINPILHWCVCGNQAICYVLELHALGIQGMNMNPSAWVGLIILHDITQHHLTNVWRYIVAYANLPGGVAGGCLFFVSLSVTLTSLSKFKKCPHWFARRLIVVAWCLLFSSHNDQRQTKRHTSPNNLLKRGPHLGYAASYGRRWYRRFLTQRS